MDLEEHLEFLGCRTSEWRSAAAEQFCNRDLSPEAREALFRLARHDSDPAVRARAWEPLGSVIDDDPRIREAMKARLNDGDAPLEERCGTLVGLAREADDPVVRRWILEFYGDPRSRAKAMEAMRASMDRRFSAYFPQHLEDPDQEIRRQAIWGVGELGIHTQVHRLRSFFDDEEFRADALFAYALAVPAEVTPGRARALLKRIDREASGLTPGEANLVGIALDNRLAAQGYRPVFTRTAADGAGTGPQSEAEPRPPQPPKAGRNEPCPCGSGRKYKKCCGA